MEKFYNWLHNTISEATEGEYCAGLSLNADLQWEPDADVSFLTVKDSRKLISQMDAAVLAGNMKVFDKRLTKYDNNPQSGFSYLVVLGQSHIMIHTWPELQLMNMDVFTCGTEGDPHAILDYLRNNLKPADVEIKQNRRGIRKDIKSTKEKVDTPKDLVPTQQGTR